MIILSLWDWVLNVFLLSTSILVFVISLYALVLLFYLIYDMITSVIRKRGAA